MVDISQLTSDVTRPVKTEEVRFSKLGPELIGKPKGYTVAWTTDPINAGNDDAAAFAFAGAEIGTTYYYSIDSDGGSNPAVTGSGTVQSATQAVAGVDVSSLEDGTLTLSAYLVDEGGNIGATVTDTVTKST